MELIEHLFGCFFLQLLQLYLSIVTIVCMELQELNLL